MLLNFDERLWNALLGEEDAPARIEHLEDKVLIEVEIPGVEKENVSLDFADGRLQVIAKGKRKTIDQKFKVPEQFYNIENITAELLNGLLTITIPKEENKVKKRIEIT